MLPIDDADYTVVFVFRSLYNLFLDAIQSFFGRDTICFFLWSLYPMCFCRSTIWFRSLQHAMSFFCCRTIWFWLLYQYHGFDHFRSCLELIGLGWVGLGSRFGSNSHPYPCSCRSPYPLPSPSPSTSPSSHYRATAPSRPLLSFPPRTSTSTVERDRYYKTKLGLEHEDEEGRKLVAKHYLEVIECYPFCFNVTLFSVLQCPALPNKSTRFASRSEQASNALSGL